MHVISMVHGVDYSVGVMCFVVFIAIKLTYFESLELDLIFNQGSFTIRSFIYWHTVSLLINRSRQILCVNITSRELALKVVRFG